MIFLVGSREWYGLVGLLAGLLAGLPVLSCGVRGLVALGLLATVVLVVETFLSVPEQRKRHEKLKLKKLPLK